MQLKGNSKPLIIFYHIKSIEVRSHLKVNQLFARLVLQFQVQNNVSPKETGKTTRRLHVEKM